MRPSQFARNSHNLIQGGSLSFKGWSGVFTLSFLLGVGFFGLDGCVQASNSPFGGTTNGGSSSSGSSGGGINTGTNTGGSSGGGTTTDSSKNPNASNSGGSAVFVPTDLATLNTYAALYPLNSPQDFFIYVQTYDIGKSSGGVGSNMYAGVLELTYYDSGALHRGHFETGTGTVRVSYQNRDTGKPESVFNQWFTYGGKSVFHGFFQQTTIGAVILVIDGGSDQGDGQGVTQLSGSLWFKNFEKTQYDTYGEKCWFVRAGPYDCRTFLNGNDDIYTQLSLYPSNGYQKLGTFTGLNRKAAFGF